jgi:nucleoside-diphosphate-sugar epimerase
MAEKILIIGACGQIGTELTETLAGIYGAANVLATDVRDSGTAPEVPYQKLDVLDEKGVFETIKRFKPDQIYHLAALLSATAEKNPKLGWQLNMDGLFYVLDAALEAGTRKVYWPSSIAAFGPNTPRHNTPQYCVMDPNTVYGISKLAGERYAEYYFKRYGLDVRSLRYPGLIGWKSAPGGGTTDYAVAIYYDALQKGVHNCFLRDNTELPMLYMPDAIRATLEIMHAPAEQIRIRSSYNLAGMSFDPATITASIAKQIPGFHSTYEPDFRQAIADSWPASIDDSHARNDWGWKPNFNLDAMTADMLLNLRSVKGVGAGV